MPVWWLSVVIAYPVLSKLTIIVAERQIGVGLGDAIVWDGVHSASLGRQSVQKLAREALQHIGGNVAKVRFKDTSHALEENLQTRKLRVVERILKCLTLARVW